METTDWPATPSPSGPHAAPSGLLAELSGGANRIAVVDCETTGVYPTDRIVEVAIVTLSLTGELVEEWVTLVQPCRDVGPTHIHGLTGTCVSEAPEFQDIAGDVAQRLDGACIAAHNFRFDYRMLASEFGRIGIMFRAEAGIDTLRATGSKLAVACSEHDVPLDNAHSALDDARAAAGLLVRLSHKCEPGVPASVSVTAAASGSVYRRADATPVKLEAPPALIAATRRLDYAGAEAGTIAYLEMVERALADLHLDRQERDHLAALAEDFGLNEAQVSQAHRRFVNELLDEAVEDEIVTQEELETLTRVASALEVEPEVVARRIHRYTRSKGTVRIEPEMTGSLPEAPRMNRVMNSSFTPRASN